MKKFISPLLVIAMVLSFAIPTFAAVEGATVSNPIILTSGVEHTKYWTKDNCRLNCYNKIAVNSDGYITFTMKKPVDSKGEYGSSYLDLYTSNGTLIWSASTSSQKDTWSDSYQYNIGLAAGTYYMNILPNFYVSSGSIAMTYSYKQTKDDYWEKEPNNTLPTATPMTLGKMYTGVFAEESVKSACVDYFSINLKAGSTYRIKIDNYAELKSGFTIIDILDSSANEAFIFSYQMETSGTVSYNDFTPSLTGTYYIKIYNNFDKVGIKYKVGVEENRTIGTVSSINITGDSPTSAKIAWSTISNVDGYEVEYSDSSHFSSWDTKKVDIPNNTTSTTTVAGLDSCGETYYFRVKGYYISDGAKVYGPYSQSRTYTTEHNYSEYTITKPATCLYSGKKTRTCSLCDDKDYETIPATGHDYSSTYTIDKEATCTSSGSKSRHCLNCTAKTDVTTIPTTGHSPETTITKATLSKNGSIAVDCAVCGRRIESETIARIGTVSLNATSFVYNGNDRTPIVTVEDAVGDTLTEDTDYTVTYSDDISSVGIHTVEINFIGNYSGSKTLSFKILPKATSKISATTSSTAIKLSWKKVTGATGYAVYQYNASSKKWVKIKTTTSLSYTVSDLKSATTYKFKVRAYAKAGSTNLWGSYSSTFTTSTKPFKATISKLTTGGSKLNLEWKRLSGVTGYQIQYSTKKDFSSSKIVTVKGASNVKKTISKLSASKTYYVRVRGYKTVNNTNFYGAYSAVKSIKVTK